MEKSEELHIKLPTKLNYHGIDSVLEKIMEKSVNSYERVIFNFTNLEFIEPKGVTLLTNLISWLKSEGLESVMRHNSPKENKGKNRDVMIYLRDIGFFELHELNDLYGEPNTRSTMLPITTIETSAISHWNDFEFLQYLRRQTSRDSEFSHIRVAVEEIFNNISDHSTENIGCSVAQYYPRNKEVSISFSDFGIGIPTSLRENWERIKTDDTSGKSLNEMSDSDLLEFAVKEGVSTRSKPGNRGAGLMNIIRSLTNDNIGRVYIRSNGGEIWYQNKVVTNKRKAKNYYPGTFFDIILYTDNESLYDSDKEEEFEW